MITASKYQKAIYNEIQNGKGNIVIQAVAGSGKTSTIVEATKLITPTAKSIFLAFNKSIQLELAKRLPTHVRSCTLHSLGLSMFYANTNTRPETNTDKLDTIIRQVLMENNIEDRYWGMFIPFLKQIIPKIKATLCNYTKYEEISELVIQFNLENDIDDQKMTLIKGVMEKVKKMVEVVDFDDMIYLPVINKFVADKYDWVFVDESQDLNKCQFELIKKICNNKTRVVAVGDKRQSIYAFRGADTTSMDNFKEYFKAQELPLSISYRCPKSVVKLAQTIVPEIECSDNTKEGNVTDINTNKVITLANDSDLVLCRTNAPLVAVCFALIRDGKKATIMGRDIGKNLIKIVDKYRVVNLDDLCAKISNLKSLQEEKLMLIEQGKLDKKRKSGFMTTIDACETILSLADNVTTIQELKRAIEEIFTDTRQGVVCSTVHKAKGLEATNVFIIKYDLMPHPMAKSDEELQQEMNIKYVAITRAKDNLYLVNK